jgi:hypothetical protein
MPNGDPEWGVKEYPKLEAFFSKISDTLEGFARKHNLTIEKYYHQGPDWELMFRHPKGGIAYVDVRKDDDEHVTISGVWWVDDYDQYTRSIKHQQGPQCTLENSILLAELNNTFKTVLSWRQEDLKPFKSVYYKEWKLHWTKEQFQKELEKYPVPNLND